MKAYDIVTTDYDSSFSHLYDLYVSVADREISYAVYNPRDAKFLALKSQPIFSPDDFKSFVNFEFNRLFRSTHILVVNPYSTIYPQSLFDKNQIEKYFEFNHQYTEIDEYIFTDELNRKGIINIYKTSKLLRELLNSYFSGYKLHHYTSPLLEGILSTADEESACHLQVNEEFVTIIINENNNLKFCNSFEFETHEDILYFTLSVYEQSALSPKNFPLKVYGNCSRFDELFILLRNYFFNCEKGNRPENHIHDSVFDELQVHEFFPLFSMPLCEL